MSKRKHGRQQLEHGRQQLEHERQRRRRKRMPHLPAHQNLSIKEQ